MVIHRPNTPAEARALHCQIANSVYLAGGTEILRLNSSENDNAEIIDINKLGFDDIFKKDGKIYIGARANLEDINKSELLPSFIREAASFCSSYEKRNAATLGGNIATRREDSYMLSSIVASKASVLVETLNGETEKTIAEYLQDNNKDLLKYFIIDENTKGWVKRFAQSSSSHASLIAAHSGDCFALSVSGSAFIFGNTPKLYESMTFKDDLTGSADYKRYLASIVFSLEEKNGN